MTQIVEQTEAYSFDPDIAVKEQAMPRKDFKLTASIELLPSQVQDTEQLSDYLAEGTDVYLPALPGADLSASARAVEKLMAQRMIATPHLAARSVPGRDVLDSWLAELSEMGCNRIFLIAGDPGKQAGPYKDSLDVLEDGLLEKHGITQIGVAGHPEGHTHASEQVVRDAFQQKKAYAASVGAQMWVVTQFMFDVPAYAKWLTEWDELFESLPVHLGIAGPASFTSLLKYAARCGVSLSTKTMVKNPRTLKLIGSWNPDQQLAEIENLCGDHLGRRLKALHLFPFGGLAKAAEWLDSE